MQSGQCENCGADYGPNDIVCSYCGSPIHRKMEGYGGFNQQSYQSTNGGTQVIQNIYVNSNGPGNTNIGGSFNNGSYGSGYALKRSRLLAAIFAIILGSVGVQFFYLNKIGLGILCVCFMYTGIPTLIGVIQGVMFLKMSDAEFEEKYHVRAV